MSKIVIITVSRDCGLIDRVEIDQDQTPMGMGLFPPASDSIHIRSDWPSLNSPMFSARLRAWHAANNPAVHS